MFVLATERISLPIKVRKEIMTLLGNIKDKKVLEYGASVGTLSKHLAKRIGEKGKLYITDLSFKALAIAQERLKNYNNLRILHDPEHTSRVHPLIPKVDAIVSAGVLSYTQKIDKVLKELNATLKKNGSFCFMEYDKFFWILPNTEWIANNKVLAEKFKKAGFSVRILRKHGILWEYVFVYGVKHDKGMLYI